VSLALIGVRKFWTRTATIVSLLIAITLLALLLVILGATFHTTFHTTSTGPSATASTTAALVWALTFPGAYETVLAYAFALAFLGIIGLIYVATLAGSEWSLGIVKVAVERGNSRW